MDWHYAKQDRHVTVKLYTNKVITQKEKRKKNRDNGKICRKEPLIVGELQRCTTHYYSKVKLWE